MGSFVIVSRVGGIPEIVNDGLNGQLIGGLKGLTNAIKRVNGLNPNGMHRTSKQCRQYAEQHFDRKLCEDVFKSDFDALQKRDRKKDKLCKKKNMILIRIKYDEPLTKTHIKKKLKEKGIDVTQ